MLDWDTEGEEETFKCEINLTFLEILMIFSVVFSHLFLPRMTLTPLNARIPFKFQRRQFSIVVSFAMTINKSQGQSLSHVRLFLKKPVFTHGQLYVALSRVTSRKWLKILVYDDDGQITNEARNVMYKEISLR